MPVLFVLIFFLSIIHFANIGVVPVFSDEAINLMWAEKIMENWRNVILPIQGSQMPLFMIFIAGVRTLTSFFLNPLYASRAFCVICDLTSAFMIFLLGKKRFSVVYGLISASIYLSFPFNFFHGRVGVLDAMTNCLVLVFLYFSLVLIFEKKKTGVISKNALFVVFFMLFSFFTKPIVLVSFLPIVFLPFFLSKGRNGKLGNARLFYLSLFVGGVVILLLFFPIYKLIIMNINTGQFSHDVAKTVIFNIRRSFIWMQIYFGDLLIGAAGFVFVFSVIKRKWVNIWFGLWIVSVIFLNSLFGKHYYPRHLYPICAPLSFMVAWGVYKLFLWKKKLTLISFFIFLIPLFFHDYQLLAHPSYFLAGEDFQQFYGDWSSGSGLSETADKLRQISRDKTIDVYVEGVGLTDWALPKLFDIGDTKVYGDDHLISDKDVFYDLFSKRRGENDAYVLLNFPGDVPDRWSADLVFSYTKSPGHLLRLYKLP